jgi:predicted RNA-binding protein associated with RNAse of E/G family
MGIAVGSEVWVARRKWPDGQHYEGLATVLGEDNHGTWFGMRVGNDVILPNGTHRTGQFDIVTCLPPNDWYLAHFWHAHPEVDVYIDICSPPTWGDGRVEVFDLDFDIVVWNAAKGGGVVLVDEDEFEQHRVELDYPVDLQENARRAAADVFARAQRGDAAFAVATAAPWFAALGVPTA